jgi:hypothetical protein
LALQPVKEKVMFGEKKKKTVPVGALDKFAVAQKMREDAQAEMLRKTGGIQELPSQTIPVTIVFVLSVVFALLLTDGGSNPFTGWHPTGIYTIDNILTGKDIASIAGDKDIDHLIVILIRGVAIFFMAGIVPLFSFIFLRLGGKNVTPLVACWGVSIVLPIVVFFLIPAVRSMGGF